MTTELAVAVQCVVLAIKGHLSNQ